jgi:hypothetical protein
MEIGETRYIRDIADYSIANIRLYTVFILQQLNTSFPLSSNPVIKTVHLPVFSFALVLADFNHLNRFVCLFFSLNASK